MMIAIVINLVMGAGQEINPWCYGNEDNDN
jgi:hypothetical protein